MKLKSIFIVSVAMLVLMTLSLSVSANEYSQELDEAYLQNRINKIDQLDSIDDLLDVQQRTKDYIMKIKNKTLDELPDYVEVELYDQSDNLDILLDSFKEPQEIFSLSTPIKNGIWSDSSC